MAADVDAQHFFFKGKLILPGVLPYIRQADFELAFLLLFHQVKQRHLPGHRVLLLLVHMI